MVAHTGRMVPASTSGIRSTQRVAGRRSMLIFAGRPATGQKFADAVFGDQDGNEGQDVLYGVSAAVRRYLWIDRERMGIEGVSYGGQADGLAHHADE